MEGGRKTVKGVWGSWKFGEEMLDEAVHRTGETEMDWALGFGHWALGSDMLVVVHGLSFEKLEISRAERRKVNRINGKFIFKLTK